MDAQICSGAQRLPYKETKEKQKEYWTTWHLKRKRSRPVIERGPTGIDKEIDIDELLITKKMKRQRMAAMREINDEQQQHDDLFSQSV